MLIPNDSLFISVDFLALSTFQCGIYILPCRKPKTFSLIDTQ